MPFPKILTAVFIISGAYQQAVKQLYYFPKLVINIFLQNCLFYNLLYHYPSPHIFYYDYNTVTWLYAWLEHDVMAGHLHFFVTE